MNSRPESPKRSLDDLLGLDADPVLGQAAQARLRERLAEACAAAKGGDTELDAALAFDYVETPKGLAERVLEGVRAERAALAEPSIDVLIPVAAANASGLRWRPRLLLPIAATAAAALTLWLMRGDAPPDGATGTEPSSGSALVAAAHEEDASDELLASLSVLENMDFIDHELDPFDADALFLFEAEDQILFDLLVSEEYEFNDSEDGGDQR